jgi:S-DNA-T family DNA segregation ATPase FtsK/SpoIIIE
MHEMDERYKRFSDIGARNLVDYNNKMIERGEEKLPMIMIMIDELADLMLSTPVETERTICRLAQMARATGIHLVVATQRPSTDVVTGLIKANFPARIAFAVASSIDSRVILDTVGAETLLGRGDMLFQSPELGSPLRVQGCFVSDRDVENLVTFWREQYKDAAPEPAPWDASMSRLIKMGSGKSTVAAAAAEDDEVLLQQAIELVRREGGASASLLQRKMRIGYPKAARLIDEMYEMGIIGPPVEAGRTRDVLPPKRNYSAQSRLSLKVWSLW